MVANTICDDSLADKKKMILKIKTLFAFDLFCQNNKFKGTRSRKISPRYKQYSKCWGSGSPGLWSQIRMNPH